jgi:hypothetical protein
MELIAYVLYFLAGADFILGNFLGIDITGISISPIIFGGIGSLFMFFHNQKMKANNENIINTIKFSISAVLIANNIQEDREVEYAINLFKNFKGEGNIISKKDDILKENYLIELSAFNLDFLLNEIKNRSQKIDESMKISILKYSCTMAIIDGELDNEEINVLHNISESLNLKDGYVQVVLKNLFDEINNSRNQ